MLPPTPAVPPATIEPPVAWIDERIAAARADAPRAPRVDDIARLLKACQSQQGHVSGVLARDWWSALMLVTFETGERAGALFALRWDWLTADGWLRVPAAARKGKGKSREYHLRPAVMARLAVIMSPRRELIFPFPYHFTTFYNRYERMLVRADLPHGRRWKLQSLRRSYASYLEAAGGDATRALAHENRRTTVRSYLDPTITTLRPDSDLLPLVG
jgi:integrase